MEWPDEMNLEKPNGGLLSFSSTYITMMKSSIKIIRDIGAG